jgi:hypothetical protein
MAHYMITLVVETDPSEGNPGRWAWQEILDTPHPVSVIDYSRLPNDPTDGEVARVHELVGHAHGVADRVLTE